MDRLIWPWKCPKKGVVSVMAFFVIASQTALSEPLTLSGGLTTRFSDNTTRVPDNKTSDAETRANLRLTHQTDPGQCNATTAADIGYGVWLDETYDPETYTSLDFRGNCELARGLTWTVTDNLRDVARDSGGTDTPDNTTRKNIFRTGPVYVLMLSDVDQLRLSAHYENTEFSEPDATDSDRYIGSVGWNRQFSPSVSAGVSLSTNQAEFDTGTEIDTEVASLNFSKSWPTTALSGSVGVSQIESRFGGNTQSSDGVVGDISLEREINPVTTFYLNGSRELTDQTSNFDVRFGEFVFDLTEVSEVEATAVNTGIRKQFSDASQIDIGLFANRADYLRSDETEDRVGLRVGYRRTIFPLLSLQTNARYLYRTSDTELNSVDDEIVSVDAGLSYELTQDLDVTGRVGRTSRYSDLSTSDYDENWISVGLDYRFF